jgi:hypothetical protein
MSVYCSRSCWPQLGRPLKTNPLKLGSYPEFFGNSPHLDQIDRVDVDIRSKVGFKSPILAAEGVRELFSASVGVQRAPTFNA